MPVGRGRAKAKQTKIARQLKYQTPEMDLESLQRELASKRPGEGWTPDSREDASEDGDYSDYSDYDEYADYDKYADWEDVNIDEDGSRKAGNDR